MSVSPYISESILDFEIEINGENKGLSTYLKKADIHYELNKIPYAKLSFISSNPDVDNEDNTLESDVIEVTDEINILIKEGEETKTLFKGFVVKLEKNADPDAGFETKIECKDNCFNLITQQDNIPDESFQDRMNRFLNRFSIENKADLQSWGNEIVSKTSNVSPWDYLVSYLDAIGLMTTIREGIFQVFDSTKKESEVSYIAQNGVNIFEFEGRQEPVVSNVIVQYWDAEKQTIENKEGATDIKNSTGTEVIDLSQSNYNASTLDQMAKARAAKNRMAALRGRVRTYGNLQAQYGNYLSFQKVNNAIDDSALIISAEHHLIENGCWSTEYSYGFENNNSFTENIRESLPTSEARLGQTNSMMGLQIGIVTKIDGDPKNQFRIRVKIPSISSKGEGVWARLSSLQAGPDRGAFFIPEVGDEVILGCFNNNPDTPVILGKLYSSARAAPYQIKAENYIQGIVSKEGTRIIIDDEKKTIEISTTKGNKFLISDDEKGFLLEDQNKNKLMLNDKGITLESNKDITLKAKGNIKIEGLENSIKASGNMKLNGALIKLN